MKKNNIYETMNMEQLMKELNESVAQYNDSDDAIERIQLGAEQQKIVKAYNELSLLTAYAACMKAEIPMIALAKQYYYETISVRDNVHTELVNGIKSTVSVRAINRKDTKFDIAKFIEWTEEANNCIAPVHDWRTKVEGSRAVIENEWKKFFAANKDTHAISITKVKKALQAMFDALVFVETATGKNAVIANGDVAKWVIAFANTRKDSKVDGSVKLTGTVLSRSTWRALQLDVLHMAVENKSYNILFGDEVEEEPNAEQADDTAAEK